ncbi:phosphatidylglycerophosphatase [Nitrosospira multiformis]|jgi:phosphatidylglycerophosphatase A|uniref:Phosphatidylglycerophosphatase n=1 Tax=Nitrosospira multiformis TaxID=1231 RepID=A0A2T5I6M1_9PROT|nr:phosphatidylglycerophosphatase A [Nitrosospira multiformis]PTQ79477.1 phosphatidylglycerophosphatase [Nitrosospira multiformis]
MTISKSDNRSDNSPDRNPVEVESTPAPSIDKGNEARREALPLLPSLWIERPIPDKTFIRSSVAHFIAFAGGAGLSPVAPGTAGTLIAFPLFWALEYIFDSFGFLLFLVAAFGVGIWACGVTGRALRNPDHGGIVWDEVTAFLLVLFFTPKGLMWQAFAFLLFRLFDIIKPAPIRYYEKKLHGGFGVMFDDLLAAFFTLLCLAFWKAYVTG